MASINILHASDLHISLHKQLRSPIDRFGDLRDPWNISPHGIGEKLQVVNNLITAWWKKMAASSYDPEILEALAEFIYQNARSKLDENGDSIVEDGEDKLDAVVLTGDLATTGTSDDIERVSKFLRARSSSKCPHKSDESDYRGATLSAVKLPILCLPGNHDRFIPTRDRYKKIYPKFYEPGGTNFDRQLFDYGHQPVQGIEVPATLSNKKKLRVVILGADFSLETFDDHEGLYGWLAQGKAYSDKRRELALQTEKLRNERKDNEVLCVLWAMHFPPGFPRYPDHGRLLREEKVIGHANRTGVRAILAGHTHEQITYRNPGSAFWVFCCGTTTQHEPQSMSQGLYSPDLSTGNFFQIITVTADDTGRVEVFGRDYRYSDCGAQSGPRLMQWIELPSPQ